MTPSIWVITANGAPVVAVYSDRKVDDVLVERQAFYDSLQQLSTGVRPTIPGDRDVRCEKFAISIVDGDHNAQ